VYISAVTRNRDHVIPKNCSATYKGMTHKFFKNRSVYIEPTQNKINKTPHHLELLRKSEYEAKRLDDEFHNSSVMITPKVATNETKTSQSSRAV
jgi:hypothetical protein